MTGTTTVRLAYGEAGLSVDLPAERTTVVEPVYVPGAPDQREVLRTATSPAILAGTTAHCRCRLHRQPHRQ